MWQVSICVKEAPVKEEGNMFASNITHRQIDTAKTTGTEQLS
jgi:hypothetical protein